MTFHEQFCDYRNSIWKQIEKLDLEKDRELFLRMVDLHEWNKKNFTKMMNFSEEHSEFQIDVAWQICQMQHNFNTMR